MKYNDAFDLWLKNNKEDIIKSWIELIKIPSIKSEAEENAPFGKNCKEALLKGASFFEKDGFETKISTRNTYALCSYGEGNKKIGIFSHSDVVPVGDDWIFTKPFEPVIIDGTLIGRGSEDNKSGIIAALCLFRFLRDNNITLKNKLELFIGSDEECGMEDLKDYLKEETMPDVSLVPDADFPCSVGEKGIYHLMSESEQPFDSIISLCGGQAYNIVLDNVEAVIPYTDEILHQLELAVKAADCATIKECDEKQIVVSFKGVAKHASIPEGSVNAAVLAAEFLLGCDFVSGNDKNILSSAKELLSCYYGKGLGIEHDDRVFGKTTCVNGLCRTVNNKLRLSFDIRYGNTVDGSLLEKIADSHLKNKGFFAIEKDNRPGFYIDENSKFPAIFEDTYSELTGERLKRITMAGGTYARRLDNAFSIGTSIIKKDRATPVFKMPEGHGGVHQCDECIDIEGFFEAVKVLFNYVLACDEELG